MNDSRAIRYYASIPKILLLLIGSGVFVVLGYGMRSSGANAVIAWFAMVLFGFCALVALALLVLAVVVRQPLLAIDLAGITARQPLMPWKVAFVPWPEIARISVRTISGYHGHTSSSLLMVYARNRERYNPSPRMRSFVDTYYPTRKGVALSAQFTFLLVWASRKRCLAVLDQIKQTFAPEIIQYGVAVDDNGM